MKADLAAAQIVGMHTAYVKVPEQDNVAGAFDVDPPSDTDFDIYANDFEALCEMLHV